MTHGGHSVFEPIEMIDDNKDNFIELYYDFIKQPKLNKNVINKLG